MLLQANPREFRLLQLRGAIFWGLFPPLLLAQTSWKIFPSDVHKHLSLRALYQTWGTESLPADCFGGKQVVLCCRTTPRRTQTCFCFLANLLAVQSSQGTSRLAPRFRLLIPQGLISSKQAPRAIQLWYSDLTGGSEVGTMLQATLGFKGSLIPSTKDCLSVQQ